MKKQCTYQNRKISFKRWRRTSWAVFASIKVVVHNCCTRISSFKDSLFKQQGTSRLELVSQCIESDTELEFEDIGIPWEEEFLTLYSLPIIINTTKIVKEASMILLSSYYISLPTKKMSVGIFYSPAT